jgi:hypothetical protein
MNQEQFNMVDFRKFKGASNLDIWKVKMNALLKENNIWGWVCCFQCVMIQTSRVLLIMVKDAMVFQAIIATTRSRRYLKCYQS